MSKNYVVQGAVIHCRYGGACRLNTSQDTHVRIGGKIITTEADNNSNCIGGFETCTSPLVEGGAASMMHQSVLSIHQMLKIKSPLKCNYTPAFYWQNAHERVEVFGCRALLEDSWTFCIHGMGIISIDNSGQINENPAQNIEANLKKLEAAVDQYIKENGIDEKHRDELLDSILLWNGYYNIPWDYEGNEMTRAFCSYLEKEDPALFNYFERGLYLPDGKSPMDITYLLGIYKAREQEKHLLGNIYLETVHDDGMFNAFLEAYQTEEGKSTTELLSYFLNYYQSSDYDSESRYSFIVESRNDAMIDAYCELQGIKNPEDYDRQDLAYGNLAYAINSLSPYNGGGDEEEIAEIDKLRNEITDKFMDKLKSNMK